MVKVDMTWTEDVFQALVYVPGLVHGNAFYADKVQPHKQGSRNIR
jgi:hypothetical protein